MVFRSRLGDHRRPSLSYRACPVPSCLPSQLVHVYMCARSTCDAPRAVLLRGRAALTRSASPVDAAVLGQTRPSVSVSVLLPSLICVHLSRGSESLDKDLRGSFLLCGAFGFRIHLPPGLPELHLSTPLLPPLPSVHPYSLHSFVHLTAQTPSLL